MGCEQCVHCTLCSAVHPAAFGVSKPIIHMMGAPGTSMDSNGRTCTFNVLHFLLYLFPTLPPVHLFSFAIDPPSLPLPALRTASSPTMQSASCRWLSPRPSSAASSAWRARGKEGEDSLEASREGARGQEKRQRKAPLRSISSWTPLWSTRPCWRSWRQQWRRRLPRASGEWWCTAHPTTGGGDCLTIQTRGLTVGWRPVSTRGCCSSCAPKVVDVVGNHWGSS